MRLLAKSVSVIFHPLLILTYMLVILMSVDPYAFGVNHISEPLTRQLLLQVFLSTFFIPAVAVGMFAALGMVTSIELPQRHDRIGPYIITGVFYLWMFRNFLDSQLVPQPFAAFTLGATIGLFLAFLINNFSKISAHAVGMGGLTGMVLITMTTFDYQWLMVQLPFGATVHLNLMFLFLLVVLMTGIVGTCRLFLKAHVPQDIYGGYLIGFASQLIAWRILMG